MILTKEVSIKLWPNNYKYYESKGYNCTNYINKIITVKTEDLPLSSETIILVQCDHCEKTIEVKYRFYMKYISRNGEYYHPDCRKEMIKPKLKKGYTREKFIEISSRVHENKYDYSLVEDFGTKKDEVTILCPIHGKFPQQVYLHESGQGCPRCAGNVRTTKEEFIEKARKVHGDEYEYTDIEYINNKTDIWIYHTLCKKTFPQRPDMHLIGHGCQTCYGNIPMTTERLITESNLVHNNKYNYEKTEYTGPNNIITVTCNKHGDFYPKPYNHLNGTGCPVCCESKGEKRIVKFLVKHQIEYVRQYKFPDCKDKRALPFDFYLPKYNLLVEYDGEIHFMAIEHMGGEESFLFTQKHDQIKNEYCQKNNLPLLRIHYLDYNNIEKILLEKLC